MKRTASVFLSLGLAAATLVTTADMSFARNRVAYCKNYAREESRHVGNADVGTGLVAGAAGGALIGALVGRRSVVPGLAIGAVGGTVAGAVSGSERRRRVYQSAYADCMGY